MYYDLVLWPKRKSIVKDFDKKPNRALDTMLWGIATCVPVGNRPVCTHIVVVNMQKTHMQRGYYTTSMEAIYSLTFSTSKDVLRTCTVAPIYGNITSVPWLVKHETVLVHWMCKISYVLSGYTIDQTKKSCWLPFMCIKHESAVHGKCKFILPLDLGLDTHVEYMDLLCRIVYQLTFTNM